MGAAAAPSFPLTERLRDGRSVTIRPLRADDRERIANAVRHLDRGSIYTRLFSYRTELTDTGLDRIMRVDPERDAMLVATTGSGTDEALIASGRFIGSDDSGARTAEIAFVVEEDYKGQGLAGRLLKYLAAIARDRGLQALTAEVLAENKAMLAVFAKSGLPMRTRREGGVVHVTLSLAGATA
jgi:RimJ/RimL family protein N-acetyltransferase